MSAQPSRTAEPLYFFLWTSWPKIVGSNLAEHSVPYKVEGKTLVVYVDNSVVAQSLHFAMPETAARIRKLFPQSTIEVIKTRRWTGPFPLSEVYNVKPPDAPEAEGPRPELFELIAKLSNEQRKDILSQLKDIKDIELKESLLQAWVHAMAEPASEP